ncbi:MAG TPA: tetratricopeptide repeat protein [Pseudonocardiaceae bacterium]|jgi:tetratricopeptide (TPR) repeat protein|nr:tetratricopeptide repeat protein [Pseudonocardiaceae bacterium]
MTTHDQAAELLADGAEALLEASFRTGDYTIAQVKLNQAREVVDDRTTQAAIADRLGWLLHFQALDNDRDTSRADEERALFQQALDIRRELGDLGGVAAALFGIGLVHQVLWRDWDTAISLFREALALAEHADVITRSEIHRHIGFYYMIADPQPEPAAEHLRTSLELRHEHDDKRWLPSGSQAFGWAMIANGRQDEAVGLIGEALDQARAVGLRASRIAAVEESLRLARSGEIG